MCSYCAAAGAGVAGETYVVAFVSGGDVPCSTSAVCNGWPTHSEVVKQSRLCAGVTVSRER